MARGKEDVDPYDWPLIIHHRNKNVMMDMLLGSNY
jgi:hypothetical protein